MSEFDDLDEQEEQDEFKSLILVPRIFRQKFHPKYRNIQ